MTIRDISILGGLTLTSLLTGFFFLERYLTRKDEEKLSYLFDQLERTKNDYHP